MPILDLAAAVKDGEKTSEDAADEARAVIASFVTTSPGALQTRLASAD